MIFMQRQRMKNLLLRARDVDRTSKIKIPRRRLTEYVETSQQKACRTCSTIIFPRSTNQTLNLWRWRCRCRRHFLNSLIARHAQLAPLYFSLPCKIATCRITSFEILKIMQPYNSELFAKPCAPSLKHNSSE